MEKIKTVLDRPKVNSEEIRSRQDLDKVLSGAGVKTPLLKSGWFYGTIGFATIAVIVGTSAMDSASIDRQDAANKVASASISAIPESENQITTSIVHHEPQEVIQQESTAPASDETTSQEKSSQNSKQMDPQETAEVDERMVGADQGGSIADRAEDIDPMYQVDQTSVKHKESITKVNGVINKMPNIAGIYYGPIPIDKLCSNNQISSSPDIEITSFKINYSTGDGEVVKSVSGNTIPADICSQLKRWSLNSTVFITEIRGVSTHGEVLMLSSMSLTPTP